MEILDARACADDRAPGRPSQIWVALSGLQSFSLLSRCGAPGWLGSAPTGASNNAQSPVRDHDTLRPRLFGSPPQTRFEAPTVRPKPAQGDALGGLGKLIGDLKGRLNLGSRQSNEPSPNGRSPNGRRIQIFARHGNRPSAFGSPFQVFNPFPFYPGAVHRAGLRPHLPVLRTTHKARSEITTHCVQDFLGLRPKPGSKHQRCAPSQPRATPWVGWEN